MPKAKRPAKPGPGRPRTRPEGGGAYVPLAERERDAINAAAEAAKLSAAQWMRRELLRAAGYRGPVAIVA